MQSIPQNTPTQLSLFDLLQDTIICCICGKTAQKISFLHLKMHGMSYDEYKAMFPDAPLTNQIWRENHRAKLTGKKRLPGVICKPRKGTTKTCEVCGKSFYRRPSSVNAARFCSRKCQCKAINPGWDHLPVMYGPDNPMWKGGYDPYYGPNWTRQKRRARARDNHTCQMCGKTEADNGKKLDVHHIIPFREFGRERYQEANRLSNLISLCHICHSHITNGIATWP